MEPESVGPASGGRVVAVATRLARPKSVTCGWPVGVDQHVRRLQIAVQNAVLVGIMDGPRDHGEVARGLARPQRTAGHQGTERLALDAAHAEIRLPVHLARAVDGDDVGMRQVRRRLGLRLKARMVRRRGQLAAQDHFQRDDALQAALPGLVDDAHAAAAQFFEQFIIAKGARQR